MAEFCYWCHEPLPPLPEDASYVDEINHYIHDECRDERDEMNRNREALLTGIAEGTIDRIPEVIRDAVLDRIRRLGFSRRCPCLYDEAYGFGGYESHRFDEDDSSNAVSECELCGGSGNYDPLPQLLELHEDKAAAAWVEQELPKSAGPCDLWTSFPEEGWHYEALGYHRKGKGKGAARGVTLYNPDQMVGGVITWLEIADVFRPRVQPSLFG